jgi:hypothetical protein
MKPEESTLFPGTCAEKVTLAGQISMLTRRASEGSSTRSGESRTPSRARRVGVGAVSARRSISVTSTTDCRCAVHTVRSDSSFRRHPSSFQNGTGSRALPPGILPVFSTLRYPEVVATAGTPGNPALKREGAWGSGDGKWGLWSRPQRSNLHPTMRLDLKRRVLSRALNKSILSEQCSNSIEYFERAIFQLDADRS